MAVGCVAIQHSQGCDTAVHARDTGPRYDAWPATRPATGPAIRRCGRHDMAPSGRAAWSIGCAPVHPTQFWTQCTVSVTVWDTVHEHCSQEIFKKIKIK